MNQVDLMVCRCSSNKTIQNGPPSTEIGLTYNKGGSSRRPLVPIMEPGFDPHKIIIIGVKFAIGHGSLDTYMHGPLYIMS